MSEGELGKRLQQKIKDGEGKVSYAFGVKPILDECLVWFLEGQPEVSPQTMRWLKVWFGFDADTCEGVRQGCGFKLLPPKNLKNGSE